jgi:peptidoglycan/xylan/chitin deacetylase (PgdA/CDA1 family)
VSSGLEQARQQGAERVALAMRDPAMAGQLLGWFTEATARELMLRRWLIALRIPSPLLAFMGGLVPGRGRREIWRRFVWRFTFWRAVRAGVDRDRWSRLTHGVPVLGYHAFAGNGHGSGVRDEPRRYVVPQRSFARQMRALAALRYRVIAFEDLARALREGDLPPRRSVVITIDDGYADNLDVACPILRRRRFQATIFLVSALLGESNEWDERGELSGRALMTADQAQQLGAEGVTVGAHTRTHASLPDLADDVLREEIAGSRQDLESSLSAPIETLAYPYGRHDERAIAAAGAAGFVGACTTDPRLVRPDDHPLRIPRVEIRASDSLARFLRKVWFGGA